MDSCSNDLDVGWLGRLVARAAYPKAPSWDWKGTQAGRAARGRGRSPAEKHRKAHLRGANSTTDEMSSGVSNPDALVRGGVQTLRVWTPSDSVQEIVDSPLEEGGRFAAGRTSGGRPRIVPFEDESSERLKIPVRAPGESLSSSFCQARVALSSLARRSTRPAAAAAEDA